MYLYSAFNSVTCGLRLHLLYIRCPFIVLGRARVSAKVLEIYAKPHALLRVKRIHAHHSYRSLFVGYPFWLLGKLQSEVLIRTCEPVTEFSDGSALYLFSPPVSALTP